MTNPVETMVTCHDNGGINKLKILLDKNTVEAENTFFKKEKFAEVSEKTHQPVGGPVTIEFLD